MRIEPETIFKMPIAIDDHGGKVSQLLNLGGNPGDLLFARIRKKMFGGSGEIFSSDRYVKFKSNPGFSKLKKEETVSYSDIVSFEPYNSSTGLTWDFKGSTGKFSIGLTYYGKVNGISPRDIFWYDPKEFPIVSGAFYKLISEVVPRTGLTMDLKASAVKHKLEEAVSVFDGSRTTDDTGLKLSLGDVKYSGFAALQTAFSNLLAGSATASEGSAESYLDLFRSLDGIYIKILKKLMVEYNSKLGNIFNREQKIYEADEKFQRLSSLWYLRQIMNLHFASGHLPEDEKRTWPMKVLKPRARTRSGNRTTTVEIKLPEPEVYEEAIAFLDK